MPTSPTASEEKIGNLVGQIGSTVISFVNCSFAYKILVQFWSENLESGYFIMLDYHSPQIERKQGCFGKSVPQKIFKLPSYLIR